VSEALSISPGLTDGAMQAPGEQVTPIGNSCVTLADVLEKIADVIQFFCALPHRDVAMLLACWIANTYTYRLFRHCGYVALRSATPRCGKSRLLEMIGGFSQGAPSLMTFPTPAVIFRTAGKEVLLLDEVDTLGERDKQAHGAILQVLNAGFQRGLWSNAWACQKRKRVKLKSLKSMAPKHSPGLNHWLIR
jgi:hypothetical protein